MKMSFCARLSAAAISGAALCTPSVSAVASDRAEVEPNDAKVSATFAPMAVGDTLSGSTTGGSGSGLSSPDYFRVKTAAAPLGIYRNRLAVSSAVSGHSVSIRGLSQFGGVIGATDVAVQTAVSSTTPARAVQWYGFGKQEEIYFRVAGSAATILPYSATLTSESVPPLTLSGNLSAGPISISTVNVNGISGLDTDIWLYDSAMNAIVDAGNDDDLNSPNSTSGFTRSLTPGTYTVAVGRFNVANNLASPTDDRWRNGPVLDFPDAVLSSAVAPASAVWFELQISDGTHPVLVQPLVLPLGGIGDIAFIRFTVQSASVAIGVGSALPDPVAIGQSTQLTVEVTPAPGSSLDNITSVTVDASPLTGNASDTAVHLVRLGTSNQWATQTLVGAGVGAGVKLVGFQILDSGATINPAVGSFPVSVVLPPPPNDQCTQAIPLTLDVAYSGETSTATATGDGPAGSCAAPNGLQNPVWHSFVPAQTGDYFIETCGANFDTVLVAFSGSCSSLTELACSDDANCGDSGLTSRIASIQLLAGQQILLRVSGFNAAAVGTYQILVRQHPPQGACCTGSCCILTTQTACGAAWTSGSTCEPNPCPAPVNDACQQALPLTLGVAAAGENCNAANALDGPTGQGAQCPTSNSGRSVWFTFVPPATASYSISTCGSAFDTVLTIFSIADCSDEQSYLQIACDDDASPACATGNSLGSRIDAVVLNAGLLYHLRLASYSAPTDFGSYQLLVLANGSFGACCGAATCQLTDQANCSEDFKGGQSCLPEVCQPPTGACCWGVTCILLAGPDCTAPGSFYAGDNLACNSPGNTGSPCCLADFNHTAGLSVQDIFDFLAGYFTGSPAADINGGGLSVQDIFDFLAAYFTGC